MLKRLLLALLLLTPLAAKAQDTTLHGLNLTGSPPANFVDNPLRYACLSSTYCWPLVTFWDGTTKVGVNADTGLNIHIVGGSIANTAFTANAGTNLNTSALATQTTLAAILSALGSPLQAGGTVSVSNTNSNGQATMANSSPVVPASDWGASPYPTAATPITASATGTTAATTATLTFVSTKTTYICGFSIRANATAAVTGNATVTGTKSGTMNFTQWTAPAASGLGVTEEVFSPCIPASAVSTSIAVVSAAPGTGGIVSVSAWGYSL